MSELLWLGDDLSFPDTNLALDDPNGLLAVGGDLCPERLLKAYSKGIFPWYSDGQPILWWTPSPRMILTPKDLHIGRSTRKFLRKSPFSVRVDTDFAQVVHHCSNIERPGQDGTWITEEMQAAYINLFRQGHAHSIEVWHEQDLVGGLYGVSMGSAFFGESMFSLEQGASKLAFIGLSLQLKQWEYKLIDCQIHTDYLASFGAIEVPRNTFEQYLATAVQEKGIQHWSKAWTLPMSAQEFVID